jgi:hypothetical protein
MSSEAAMNGSERGPGLPTDDEPIGRRKLLFATGAAALAAGTLGVASRASAETLAPHVAVRGNGESVHPFNGAPPLTAIGSAPITGYVYKSASMYDFFPFNPSSAKTWGGFGVYTAGSGSSMRATVEVPPGALLRDVEYYVYNNAGSNTFTDTWLYLPGQGTITSLSANGTIPSNGAISAVRVEVPSTLWGPYPVGSVLLVGMSTPTDATVQINGARVGFSHGGGTTGLFAGPHRVYDSRKTSKIGKGKTRTITLSADLIPPGVSGVILNVHAQGATKAGSLKVYAGDASAPSASTISFQHSGEAIADGITIPISSTRKIKVYASEKVDVIVDLLGTVS